MISMHADGKLISVEKSASGLVEESASSESCQKGRDKEGRRRALSFWSKQQEERKLEDHCGRCGKPSVMRTCQKCRDWHKANKAKKNATPASVAAPLLAALKRRVESLELAVARLQLGMSNAYKRGYDAGRTRRAACHSNLHDRKISKEERSNLCHAYRKSI